MSLGGPSQARRRGLRSLTAALGVMAAAVLPASLLGALGPLVQKTFEIGDATLGALLALFFGCSALTAAWGGRYADLVGWRVALRLSAGLSGLTLLGIAFATPTLPALMGWLVLGGVAISLAAPTSNLVIAREMPVERLGLLMGIKQTSIPLSTLFAGLSLPVLALNFGWRWAFMVAAVIPVGSAVVAGRHGKSLPHPRSTGAASSFRTGPRRPSRPLVLLAFGGALAGGVANALGAFAVLSAVDSGVSLQRSGVLVATASGAGFSARIALGMLVDRWNVPSVVVAAVALVVGGPAALLLAIGSSSTAVVGTIVAYGGGWSWPGLLHHGIVTSHPRDPGTASGVVQIGLSLGSATGPAVFGLITEQFGFGAAWVAMAILSLAAAATMVNANRFLGREAS